MQENNVSDSEIWKQIQEQFDDLKLKTGIEPDED